MTVAVTDVQQQDQCSPERARKLTHELQQSLEVSCNLLREVIDQRAWAALGYDSWAAYCEAELQTGVRLARELRQQVVFELTSGPNPMSDRAIAVAIGVDHKTIDADRTAQVATFPHLPEPDEVIDVELVPERRKVTGADGKTYTRPPTSRPEPRVDELAKEWRAAEIALTKVTKKLKHLMEHDQFAAHAARLDRGDVYRASGRIATVLDALSIAMVRDAAEETENG